MVHLKDFNIPEPAILMVSVVDGRCITQYIEDSHKYFMVSFKSWRAKIDDPNIIYFVLYFSC